MKIKKKALDSAFVKKWMKNGINPIVLSIINRRGLQENDFFDIFLPVFENIPSPFLFKDIIIAYNRIEKAILNNEKIIVFGDKDVDGTTSTTIIVKFFRDLGLEVEWETPINNDPYGLNKNKIETWKIKNYNLCITVDCGITNTEEVEILKQMNIDTIILDHHEPLSKLPNAISIINPKNETKYSPNNIAACGVCFLFIYGYLFFKNALFNKHTAIIYTDKNELISDVYKNLIKIKTIKINDIKNLEKLNCDYYFLYSTENNIQNDLKSKISDLIILPPIENIYDTKVLNLINDTPQKMKIVLFNSILDKIKNLNKVKEEFLPLVMLGTIADIMPLKKVNRIFVHLGLKYIKNSIFNKSLLKLCKQINLNLAEISSKDISWSINPLLNAPGRMGNAPMTVDFFINDGKNIEIIKNIISTNEKKKNFRRKGI